MPRSILNSPQMRCLVMGIVNITPDSFSGDGLGRERDIIAAAVAQSIKFCEAGVDILDIGGESTRPGAAYIPAEEEAARIAPVIAALRRELTDVAISIDTYKASVAQAALEAGADIINDVWAFQADPKMAIVARETDCPVILMHNRSKPGHAEIDRVLGGSYTAPDYGDGFLRIVCQEMSDLVQNALDAGIRSERIILDPGVGFGKTPSQNMALIEGIDIVRALGYPVLLGASRKSFMGRVLNLPADDRRDTTLATTALAVQRGAAIVRVHDVEENVKVVRMTEAMLQAGKAARAEGA
ncbi:MAG: dihydropteroate synthase [Alphaproteobacteria bacterium]|nr:dihydropteroate synthase [Alphaproteobacteria bacterium]